MAKLWRYCPSCYRLADSASLLKRCPYCVGRPNNLLTTLPLDNEAAQAAIRIGGTKALEEMIVGLVAGEDAVQAYDSEAEELVWEMTMYPQVQIARPKK